MEIERKWKLKNIPVKFYNKIYKEIRQGYILDNNVEIRIRSETEFDFDTRTFNYYLTIKGGGNLSREEFNIQLSNDEFNYLWSHKINHYLVKDRFIMNYDSYTLELDVYKNELFGLIILECEFKSIEEANLFQLPSFIIGAEEVTTDPAYKNKELSKRSYVNKKVNI